MTYKQYLRLTLVAILPLLIASLILAHSQIPPRLKEPFIMCEYDPILEHDCRNLGWDWASDHYDNNVNPAEFDIQISDTRFGSPHHIATIGSSRRLEDAKVVSAQPYNPHGPEMTSLMGGFVGRTATVTLGIPGEQRSYFENGRIILFCNSVSFEPQSNQYQSGCFGNGWQGLVVFELDADGQAHMDTLKKVIIAELDSIADGNLAYRILMYPFFVYLFFFLSGIIWITIRAYRFVKTG